MLGDASDNKGQQRVTNVQDFGHGIKKETYADGSMWEVQIVEGEDKDGAKM